MDRANGVPEAIARCKQGKAKRQASIDRGRDNLQAWDLNQVIKKETTVAQIPQY